MFVVLCLFSAMGGPKLMLLTVDVSLCATEDTSTDVVPMALIKL